MDYRSLNKNKEKNNYPLPLIEDHIDTLRGKKYFSLLDLKDGFHHIKIAENSIRYTSFNTHHEQYEYLWMPFGMKKGPSVFQKFINTAFSDLIAS